MNIFSKIASFFKGGEESNPSPKADNKVEPGSAEEKKASDNSQQTMQEYANQAIELLKQGKGPEAAELLAKAADMGLATAQNNLGLIYIQGLAGAPQNPALAEKYMRMAAEQGLLDAQFNLGFMHTMGHAPNSDIAEGVKWIVKAASQGHPKALHVLQTMRKDGVIDENNNLKIKQPSRNVYSELLEEGDFMNGPVLAVALVEAGQLLLVEIIRKGNEQFGQSNEMLLSIRDPQGLKKLQDALMAYNPAEVARRIAQRCRPEGRYAVREFKYILDLHGIPYQRGISMI